MKANDIYTVALGLKEARPGSYPSGLPDTDQGWDAWRGVCYTVQVALARTTRDWTAYRRQFEILSGQIEPGE